MSKDIPYGYCQCGCGQKTKMSDRNRLSQGIIKDKPLKFIYGHSLKVNHPKSYRGGKSTHTSGYSLIACPEHNRAHKSGYVFEHIAIAEKILGEPLPANAVIHHVNGDVSDNRPGNLVVCQDGDYHKLLHQRTRALAECGHANWMKCVYCGQYDKPENLYIYRYKKQNKIYKAHRECKKLYQQGRSKKQ